MDEIKIAVIGAGYFSHFHFDAWSRIEGARVVACCDIDLGKAQNASAQYDVPEAFASVDEMLDSVEVDAVDIITRPDTHLDMVALVADHEKPIICQKPLAPTFDESVMLVRVTADLGVRLMVHENFRFQPWYREMKSLILKGTIGDRLHRLSFRNRAGDGWGEDAYMARQPYFQTMEKFLIHEAGIHTIDTFRYLAGEINRVWCVTRKLNPVIAGEDSAVAIMEFEDSGLGMYDANRFNESTAENQRYTFGDVVIEGNEGTIRLYDDGRLTIQRLGKAERDHAYSHSTKGFAGDCVKATQEHFINCLRSGEEFETSGEDYLNSLAVQEAMYLSAKTGHWESPQMKQSPTGSPFAPRKV